jgi:probable rRNA maturation factor
MNHNLSLAVQYASDAYRLPTRAQFRRWIKAALLCDASITLRIVDEQEGRKLNDRYRGKDYATNVLTFSYDDAEPHKFGQLSGDVVICSPVAEREAEEQHKELFAHYAHLAVHATLHLQGYEHENDADTAVMEALESALVLKLGYSDPYRTIIDTRNGLP